MRGGTKRRVLEADRTFLMGRGKKHTKTTLFCPEEDKDDEAGRGGKIGRWVHERKAGEISGVN